MFDFEQLEPGSDLTKEFKNTQQESNKNKDDLVMENIKDQIKKLVESDQESMEMKWVGVL